MGLAPAWHRRNAGRTGHRFVSARLGVPALAILVGILAALPGASVVRASPSAHVAGGGSVTGEGSVTGTPTTNGAPRDAIAAPPLPADAPTYLGENTRDGYAPNFTAFGPGNVSGLRLAWSTQLNRSILGSLIVVHGVVYVGTDSGYLNALNASTGVPLGRPSWALPYLGNTSYSQCGAPNFIGVRNLGIIPTATYGNGTLYEAGGNTSFYELSTNGTIEKRVDIGNTSTVTPYVDDRNWDSPLVVAGAVYYGTGALCEYNRGVGGQAEWRYVQAQLLKIDPRSGVIVGKFNVTKGTTAADVGGSIWSSPSYDPTTNLVWFTTGNENESSQTPAGCEYPRSIVALNATTLAYVGAYQVGVSTLDEDYGAGPTIFHDASGHELVGALNKNGLFSVVNATPAAATNCSTLLNKVWQVGVGTAGPYGPIAPASFDGTRVYVAGDGVSNNSAELLALRPSDGAIEWRHDFSQPFPSTVHAGVVSANGLVYAAGVNASTGTGPGPGGSIEVLDAATGQLLFDTAVAEPISAAPVLAEGKLFVATGWENSTGVGYVDAFDLPTTPQWIDARAAEGPAASPPPTSNGSLVWDPASSEYVAFGGCDPAGCPSNETWVLANGSWRDITNSTLEPPARSGAAIDYDPSLGAVLLYGGCGVTTCPRNDLWEFSRGNWTNVTSTFCPASVACPPPLHFASLVAVPSSSVGQPTSLLFGGCLDANCSQESNRSFAFSVTAGWSVWTTGSSLPATARVAAAFYPAIGAIAAFGGIVPCSTGTCDGNSTWLWRPSTGWGNLSSALAGNIGPTARDAASFVATRDGSALLLLGGWNSTRQGTSDSELLTCGPTTCGWDPWSPSGGPGGRAGMSAAGGGDGVDPVVLGGWSVPGTPLSGWWEIGAPMSVNVTANPTSIGPGGTVSLGATASGGFGPYGGFSWQFASGTFLHTTARNLTVIAPGRGYVNGSVWSVDAAGTVAGAPFSIAVVTALRVSIAASATPTEVNISTTFSASVPTGITGGPFRVVWNFGDGSIGFGATVHHAYVAAGTFPVTATVADIYGNTNFTRLPLVVDPPPSVLAAANRTIADVGGAFSFTAAPYGGVGALALAWNFGDGTTEVGNGTVAHVYGTPGGYVVAVRTTDAFGVSANATVPVGVDPALSVGISVSPTGRTTVGSVFHFSALAAGGAPSADGDSYAWSFGDGSVATGGSANHSYGSIGTYVVDLRANDSTCGFAGAAVQLVVVYPTTAHGPQPTTRGPTQGAPLWIFAAAGVGGLAGLGAAYLLMGRRRRGA